MELQGRKELVDTGKSSHTWSVPTVSLRLAVLNVFQGFFGPKMAIFGLKLQFLKPRSATCESRSRPPPLGFLLKLCVIVLHTHWYQPPKFHPNQKHHDGDLILPPFAHAAACWLLAAATAAAKPGRFTLDTKRGYKIKTGSTRSVTLTLTPALTLALALSPERGQGGVTGACAPPPHHHPKSPHLDPPPQGTLPTHPPIARPEPPLRCPPLPPHPGLRPISNGRGGSRTKARRRPTRATMASRNDFCMSSSNSHRGRKLLPLDFF